MESDNTTLIINLGLFRKRHIFFIRKHFYMILSLKTVLWHGFLISGVSTLMLNFDDLKIGNIDFLNLKEQTPFKDLPCGVPICRQTNYKIVWFSIGNINFPASRRTQLLIVASHGVLAFLASEFIVFAIFNLT